MTIFVTSDNHWHHNNIIKYCKRPFGSVEEMNESMISNWNSVVKQTDEVYHIGDFAFCSQRGIRELTDRLNGTKFLIRGNHDLKRVSSAEDCGFEWVKDYHMFRKKRFGQKVTLHHYPSQTWDSSHHGSYMLHGHCHGTVNNVVNGQTLRRLDVGVDKNNYTPLSMEEVIEYMENIEIPFLSDRIK